MPVSVKVKHVKKQKRLDASEMRNEWRNGYVIYKAVIIKCGI